MKKRTIKSACILGFAATLLLGGSMVNPALADPDPSDPHYDPCEDQMDHYIAPSTRTTETVFNTLVLPTPKTKKQKAQEEAKQALKLPASIGAALKYEEVRPDGSDNGDIYGVTMGMAWDTDTVTYGVLLPYENFDFDGFDADQLGLVGYGQYTQDINDQTYMTYTANINYVFTDVDFDGGGNDDINTYGLGLSSSVTFDLDDFVHTLGLSYQYNIDDSNTSDDDQHLLRAGVNLGARIMDTMVASVFLTWTWDVTSYDVDLDDDDYFELGAEFQANLSDTWALNFGVKELIDLNNVDATEIYLGSIWKF